MNNYYRQNEDQYNRQGYYTNTYSLWQNSQYYDTNNLSLRNYITNDWKYFENVHHETPLSSTYRQNRMVLNRGTLYNERQSLDNDNYQRETSFNPTQNSSTFEWRQQNWVKAGDSSLDTEPLTGSECTSTFSSNRLERNLNKALKKPVKMTKAESIMQRMGWQGGALGKTGDGILVPIAPNAVYATTTAGFGHRYEPESQKKTQKNLQKKQKQIKQQHPQQIISGSKKPFYTDVLQRIVTFVRNDLEMEMLFDKTTLKADRKRIHMLVNEVINSDSPEDAMYADEVQTDLLRQIEHYNCYILSTQSYGEASDRQLTLYKEAPAHVFLITPDDLREKDVEDEVTDVDIDESNPFLKSITKNIKENNSNKPETCEIDKVDHACLNKIIAYFEEFQGSDEFTELRFLGPFNFDEIQAINTFLNDVNKCIVSCYRGVSADLVKLFEGSSRIFQMNNDVNGSAVVHKLNEEQQEPENMNKV